MSDSEITKFRDLVLAAVKSAVSSKELAEVKVKHLGKVGFLAEQFAKIASLPKEHKKDFASAVNACRGAIQSAFEARQKVLEEAEERSAVAKQLLDVTAPIRPQMRGRIHPLSKVAEMLRLHLANMGMRHVEGPEIESEYHVFDALNVPADHPAREMQDTLYLANGRLLRPHTSSVQVRAMKGSRPPISVFSIGKVYRDDDDATHTPMFHQVEGLYIAKNVDMGHLKGFVSRLLNSILKGADLRFRPSFFPFTSPSAEVDVRLPTNKAWLEILGCGLVHPNVLAEFGVPSGYSGFAFGMGLERITMIMYGISDLRMFFNANLDWLRYYGSNC